MIQFSPPKYILVLAVYCCFQLISTYGPVEAFQQLLPPISHSRSRIFRNYDKSSSLTKSLRGTTLQSATAQDLDSLLVEFQSQYPNAQVLKCDADQVQSMNEALWSTLADLSSSDKAQKLCVVLDKIPQSAITSFVSDFTNIKLEERLMRYLPELRRIQIDLLGDSTAPALVMETTPRTSEEMQEKSKRDQFTSMITEAQCTAALKRFVDTMVVRLETCPYTKTPDLSATGLQKRGVSPGPVAYRYSDSADACQTVATFWRCVSELLSTPETEISTTLLSLPAIGPGIDDQNHDRFAAVVELISRNLCLFRGDGAVGLVHFHPSYTRDKIHPANAPAFGHLPPQSWLKPMLLHNNNVEEAHQFTDHDWSASNYQRRAPHTMINILRVSQLNAAVGAKSIVDLPLPDGTTQKASGIPLYSRNAIRLAERGSDQLQQDLEAIWEEFQ